MKKINEYKAIILDVDGTLYFQTPLRIHMALNLLMYYLTHPLKIKDLFILRYYRKLRENEEVSLKEDFTKQQFKIVAKKFNISSNHIERIINYWIYKKPIKYVKRFKDNYLINQINLLHEKGFQIIVYSDYPAEEKIEALGLICDKIFSSNDKEISCLKPDTRGLNYILSMLDYKKEEILFIGDRYEKDGICAKKCGIDCIILSPNKRKRNKQIGDL